MNSAQQVFQQKKIRIVKNNKLRHKLFTDWQQTNFNSTLSWQHCNRGSARTPQTETQKMFVDLWSDWTVSLFRSWWSVFDVPKAQNANSPLTGLWSLSFGCTLTDGAKHSAILTIILKWCLFAVELMNWFLSFSSFPCNCRWSLKMALRCWRKERTSTL